MNQWWGIIKKDQNIELVEYKDGDKARIRRAYMNEKEIDFVIEPFPADSFQEAKLWVQDCVNDSKILSIEMMYYCRDNAKKELDNPEESK